MENNDLVIMFHEILELRYMDMINNDLVIMFCLILTSDSEIQNNQVDHLTFSTVN